LRALTEKPGTEAAARAGRAEIHPNTILRRHPFGHEARRVRAVCTNADALWKGLWRRFFPVL
jgi:hypothetical protein